MCVWRDSDLVSAKMYGASSQGVFWTFMRGLRSNIWTGGGTVIAPKPHECLAQLARFDAPPGHINNPQTMEEFRNESGNRPPTPCAKYMQFLPFECRLRDHIRGV